MSSNLAMFDDRKLHGPMTSIGTYIENIGTYLEQRTKVPGTYQEMHACEQRYLPRMSENKGTYKNTST